jgi:hypothetical protein
MSNATTQETFTPTAEQLEFAVRQAASLPRAPSSCCKCGRPLPADNWVVTWGAGLGVCQACARRIVPELADVAAELNLRGGATGHLQFGLRYFAGGNETCGVLGAGVPVEKRFPVVPAAFGGGHRGAISWAAADQYVPGLAGLLREKYGVAPPETGKPTEPQPELTPEQRAERGRAERRERALRVVMFALATVAPGDPPIPLKNRAEAVIRAIDLILEG